MVIRENGPVRDTSNTGEHKYENKWVAEVVIAHPNGDIIRKYNAQQARMEEVRDVSGACVGCFIRLATVVGGWQWCSQQGR